MPEEDIPPLMLPPQEFNIITNNHDSTTSMSPGLPVYELPSEPIIVEDNKDEVVQIISEAVLTIMAGQETHEELCTPTPDKEC